MLCFADEFPDEANYITLRFNPKLISKSFIDAFYIDDSSIFQSPQRGLNNFPEKEKDQKYKKLRLEKKSKSSTGFFNGCKVNLRNAP